MKKTSLFFAANLQHLRIQFSLSSLSTWTSDSDVKMDSLEFEKSEFKASADHFDQILPRDQRCCVGTKWSRETDERRSIFWEVGKGSLKEHCAVIGLSETNPKDGLTHSLRGWAVLLVSLVIHPRQDNIYFAVNQSNASIWSKIVDDFSSGILRDLDLVFFYLSCLFLASYPVRFATSRANAGNSMLSSSMSMAHWLTRWIIMPLLGTRLWNPLVSMRSLPMFACKSAKRVINCCLCLQRMSKLKNTAKKWKQKRTDCFTINIFIKSNPSRVFENCSNWLKSATSRSPWLHQLNQMNSISTRRLPMLAI